MIKNKLEIKHRIYNNSLNSGNKKTGEKNLLKSLKKLQKLTKKRDSSIISLAIKNSTPTLKMNKQKMKKRKKNKVQEIPTFIRNNFLRVNLALKYLLINSENKTETTKFCNKFATEILDSAFLKSVSINKKEELQKQILLKNVNDLLLNNS